MTVLVVKLKSVEGKLQGEVVARFATQEQATTDAEKREWAKQPGDPESRGLVHVTIPQGSMILGKVWK